MPRLTSFAGSSLSAASIAGGVAAATLKTIDENLNILQFAALLGGIDGYFDFSPDGRKMFAATTGGGPEGDESVNEFSLSTAWDPSTASVTGASLDLDQGGMIGVSCMTVKPDGTRMFIAGTKPSTYQKCVMQWELSTPWDLSSAGASPSSTYDITNWGSTRGLGQMFWLPDGSGFWLAQYDNFSTHTIKQYNTSTWSLSGASEGTVITLNGSGSQNRPEMMTFNHDGTEFAIGRGDGYVSVYTCSTPYTMTQAIYDSGAVRGFSPATVDPANDIVMIGFNRIKFYDEGTRMFRGGTGTVYELGNGGHTVYRALVRASGNSAYDFYGGGSDFTGLNPSITMNVGDVLELRMFASGHPLWIKPEASTGQANALDFFTNGRDQSVILWKPTAPGTYYYNCEFHSPMRGTITVS